MNVESVHENRIQTYRNSPPKKRVPDVSFFEGVKLWLNGPSETAGFINVLISFVIISLILISVLVFTIMITHFFGWWVFISLIVGIIALIFLACCVDDIYRAIEKEKQFRSDKEESS